MKKTKRLASVLALLLAALMLFSSCAISYKEADPTEYVQLVNGFDFRNFKLDAEIEKMVVKDEDVATHINKLLFALREKSETAVNQPGAFDLYDTLSIRTLVYDKDGNLISTDSNFSIADSKTPTDENGRLTLSSDKALYLGYGVGLNTGLMKALEDKLFLNPEDVYLLQNYRIEGKNVSGLESGALGAIPVIGYVSYSATYKKGNTTHDASGRVDAATPMHFEKIGADIAVNGEGAGNKYDEIIYLGLKELIERQASVEDKQIKPTTGKGKDNALTIKVFPTANAEALEDASLYGDRSTAIAYDINFEDLSSSENYAEGTITVYLQGSIDFTSEAVTPGAFVTTYTYPEDSEGTYKVGTTTKKLKDAGECTVYTYITERAPYTRPEYNADTVKNKLNFTTDKTEDNEVIEEYEASIMKELQDACDAITKEKAKAALWTALLKNTKLIKDPVANIKAFQNEIIDLAKANYYDGGLCYQTQKDKNGNVIGYLYDDFNDYLKTFYRSYQTQHPNGDTTSKLTREEIDNDLYARGRELVKESLIVYYLADQIGCRYTDAELLAMAEKRGTAWAEEQIKAGREYIIESNSVETLSKQYSDAKKKEQFFKNNEVKSFEEYLAKLLERYSEAYGQEFKSWTAFAETVYPDDAYNWENYVEAMQGEETLYGTYHYEVVLEKIYEANLNNLADSYKEIAYDANKVAAAK